MCKNSSTKVCKYANMEFFKYTSRLVRKSRAFSGAWSKSLNQQNPHSSVNFCLRAWAAKHDVSSHKNMRACKKSAPFDHIWPCLAPFSPFGHVWSRKAPFRRVWPRLAMFGPAWPNLALIDRSSLISSYIKVRIHWREMDPFHNSIQKKDTIHVWISLMWNY